VAFKKPKKVVGKKRAAEEDIVEMLEKRSGEEQSGLGSRE
jgi:hypothetical protein